MDRVTEFAKQIYLSLVVGNDTRTPDHHAANAFEKAAAFWAYADAKKKSEGEK